MNKRNGAQTVCFFLDLNIDKKFIFLFFLAFLFSFVIEEKECKNKHPEHHAKSTGIVRKS